MNNHKAETTSSKASFSLDEQPTRIRNGMYISRSLAAIIIVFFLVILLTVGLLAGLLAKRTSTETYYYVLDDSTTTTSATTTYPPATPSVTTTTDLFGNGPWQNIRLQEEIEPINYKLSFYDINTDLGSYEGKTIIKFNLAKSLNHIMFHIKNITISPQNVKLYLDNNPITIDRQFSYIRNQYYVLESNGRFDKGEYKLEIIYTGYTNIGIVGMYQSSYTEDGEKKIVIGSKFEPTDARKAFPCFDEPQLKASFDVSIEHDSDTIALSNFPVLESISMGPKNITSFNTTFVMSTYLVAWAIVPNDWNFVEDFTAKHNKPIRVYGTKYAYKENLLTHALKVAKISLDYFEIEYFNISEAVPPKIDLLAFPEFPSGAMEHWGLIGFRDTSLHYSNLTSSAGSKQNIALTVAHEVAHFWFGNLVTCKWWNDLWLNEAMASFLEYKPIQKAFPEWNVIDQIINLDMVPVMWDDAFPSSHPVEANVETPDQINNVFDSITYAKGLSVLRQLENVVGPDGFQKGLQKYLRDNMFKPGVAAQFYDSLELPNEMKDKTTPSKFMATWLLQMNYPKIDVDLKRTASSSEITFSQSRFLITPFADSPNPTYISPFNYTWEIFLRCTVGGRKNPAGGVEQHLEDIEQIKLFLNKKSDSMEFAGKQFTWVKCNPEFTSFYTTRYDDGIYGSLQQVLSSENYEAFKTGDRADLIHTSFQLAYQGSTSYSNVDDLTEYLTFREKDYVPWRIFIYHINLILGLMEHRPGFEKLSDYAINVVENNFETLDLYQEQELDKPKSHLQSLLESTATSFLCRLQDQFCLSKVTRLYSNFSSVPGYFNAPNDFENPIAPNIRSIVYRYKVQTSFDPNDWSNMFKLYQSAQDPQERSNALTGMSSTRIAWVLNRFLDELTKTDSKIRFQDFFTVLNAISRNPSGRNLAWNFYRQNWKFLVDKFKLTDRTFGRSIKALTETFSSDFYLEEMESFFKVNSEAGAGKSPREQSIEAVKTNIFWIDKREADLIENLTSPL